MVFMTIISSILATLYAAVGLSNPTDPTQKNQTQDVLIPPSTVRSSFLASSPRSVAMGTYVGELQEKWQFPSDHLPIGMTFENMEIASWNVLDAKFMAWVTQNSQGLSRSLITQEDVAITNSELTIRDQHNVCLILEMIHHPTHPRSLICLQECGTAFIKELKTKLPSYFTIISHHGESTLIDTRSFKIEDSKKVAGIFTDQPKRTIQEITVTRKANKEKIRLINAHLPGDPQNPGYVAFTQYLAKTFDPTITTIAMGDMNFNEIEIYTGLNQSFRNHSPMGVYSPYPTNISPYDFYSKAIDHFIIYSPIHSSVTLNTPDEVMTGLQPTASLLTESAQKASRQKIYIKI